jgi:CDGSH-type Zn-finger protein/ferredoxin
MAVPTIECKPNGPYLVKGLSNLRNSRGEALAVEAVVALCRCGGSATKPFCDGTHRKNGFSDARSADATPDRSDAYPAATITIHDNRGICAHSALCTDRLASVFKYGSEPWIDPSAADAAAIIEAIEACPSGALSYSINGVVATHPERPPGITVTKDGPYAVVGSIALVNVARGQGASAEHYTLCRCGASKNKPFCDGSHWDAGFSDEKN